MEKEFYMKNFLKTFGIIAFVAVLGLGLFTSCGDDFFVDDEQTVVVITNIPNEYNQKWAYGGLGNPNSSNKKSNDFAFTIDTVRIQNNKVTFDMFKDEKGKYKEASVSALAIVLICITESQTVNSNTQSTDKYLMKSVTPGLNTFDYSDFKNLNE